MELFQNLGPEDDDFYTYSEEIIIDRMYWRFERQIINIKV